jgi:dTDP-4-dehydrorhamnose reductase
MIIMVKQKLLVTGASGFLGWNLCQVASIGWHVAGIVHNNPVKIDGVQIVQVDITDKTALKEIFCAIKPQALIHCAACSKPNYCESHEEESYGINVEASAHIASLCAKLNAACVFTSTDLVFDGTGSMYKEDDPVSPLSVYAKHKVEAEHAMRAKNPAVTVCRMPLMFGYASPASGSLIQPMIASLRAGESVSLFADEYRSPASALSASSGLLLALNHPGETYHCGGAERMSRHNFGLLVAEKAGCPKELIKKTLQRDVPMVAPRPPDVSLDITKARSIGYNPLSVRDELERLYF